MKNDVCCHACALDHCCPAPPLFHCKYHIGKERCTRYFRPDYVCHICANYRDKNSIGGWFHG